MQASRGRSYFLGAGVAFAAVGAVRAPLRAAQFVYKLAHGAVDDPPSIALGQMAAAINAETHGRMEVQVFPNAVLGSGLSMLSQVRLGSIQFYWANSSSYSSVVPLAQIDGIGFIFASEKKAFSAMDGPLGAYVRQEFLSKGLYAFDKPTSNGFRETTSGVKPIRTVDDLAGIKIRTLPAPVYIELFKALGASPAPVDFSEMYTALQTHLVDGCELAPNAIEAFRIYEVQKYLSLTNHIWGGEWMAANLDAWNALPSDIQDIVKRNATKYILSERREMARTNDSVVDTLKRQGLAFNTVDTGAMRARIRSYYAHWKGEFGATAWNLLEAAVGKLA